MHREITFKNTVQMATYAYIRVSTQTQTLENQRFEIEQWSRRQGVRIDFWVTETVSGTVGWEKRKLGRLLRRMKKTDLLVCTEISRLGRSMLMVMSVLNACSQKGVFIRTIKDNFNLSDSINSKIIAFAFALAAEIERNLISQRTREALAARKQAGVHLGRPPGPSGKLNRVMEDLPRISAMLDGGATKTAMARMYKIHRNTLNKCLKVHNK